MIKCEVLQPRWDGPIIVAASGPSLTKEVAKQCQGHHVICIKWAAQRMPWADVLYACNQWQWDENQGFPSFQGERWSCHHERLDNKFFAAQRWGIRLVRGDGFAATRFSTDPSVVHYGRCSGFVGVGLAIHWIRRPGRIGLVGFDFKGEGKGKYFFGEHPRGPAYGGRFDGYRPSFEGAAKKLPKGVEIVNCTPKSALKCFPKMSLEEFLNA